MIMQLLSLTVLTHLIHMFVFTHVLERNNLHRYQTVNEKGKQPADKNMWNILMSFTNDKTQSKQKSPYLLHGNRQDNPAMKEIEQQLVQPHMPPVRKNN